MLQIYLALVEGEDSKRSFEELYHEYRQYMFSVAFAILKNNSDAEDAVQEAFLAIANNFKKISSIPCQELKFCIVIIVRNKAIDIYNKNKRRSRLHTELNEATAGIDVDFFERYNHELLLEKILKLDVIYRDALYLRYVNGFSVKEISKMLGTSENTVSKRIERAKSQLKELLKEDEEN